METGLSRVSRTVQRSQGMPVFAASCHQFSLCPKMTLGISPGVSSCAESVTAAICWPRTLSSLRKAAAECILVSPYYYSGRPSIRRLSGVLRNIMFDMVTSHDFYAMLVQDFNDFMNEQCSARRALHCAVTAYHLHEWVWGDWLSKDYGTWKALGIRDRDSFLAWIGHVCP
jgi:hypothetical protein